MINSFQLPKINTKRSIEKGCDHNYSIAPKKKKKDGIDDVYHDTVTLLRAIHNNLIDLKDTVKMGLNEIAGAVKENKRK